MNNLLIIDSRIINLNDIILSIKSNVQYIILDYYNDTFNSLINKINNLNLVSLINIGLLRHGYYSSTYLLLNKQEHPSIIYNVKNIDPNINSWLEIKNFLLYLLNTYNIQNFDFLSCRLDLYSDYIYIFLTLSQQTNINIRACKDELGNLKNGGTWIVVNKNNVKTNIQDIYFSDLIFNYPYLFFMPTLSIKADSYTKQYDRIIFNNPNITFDGFIDNDDMSILSGTINYSGTYITAINVGSYTIIPSGLISTKYYLNFEIGYLNIIPSILTISVNNYVKIYDGLNDLINYTITYTGLADNESYSSFTGSIILQGPAINAVNVGNYTIIPYGLVSTNYNIIFEHSTLSIIPASLLIIANDLTLIYNGQAFYGGNGVIYNGFVNNEDSSILNGTLTYLGDSQGAIFVNTYTIIPSGLYSDNYNITFINATLNIYSESFLILANNFTKFYDNLFYSNPTITLSKSNDLSGSLSFDGNYINALDVSSYIIYPNGYYSNNYNISYFTGTLNINLNEIKVIANDYNKLYDAIPFDNNGYYLLGLQGNDTSNNFIGNMINIGTSYGAIGIGTYNIIPSNIFSKNYKIIYVEGQLTITQSPLYIVTSLYSKVYDGYDTIHNEEMQSNIIIGISGIMNNEFISVISYTASYRNINAGYQFIDISYITLSGFTLTNYYLVPLPSIIGLITPKPITALFSGGNKSYDGTRIAPPLLWSLSGIIGYEDISISSYFAQYKTPNVGNQLIDISNVILYGETANNYIVSPIPPIKALIYQNFLVIDFFDGNKIYDSFYQSGPLSWTISGEMAGDILTISSYVAIFRNNNVGLQIIDISNVILTGTNAYTYTVPKIAPISAYIYKRYITATFTGGNKIYDGTLKTMNIVESLSGFYGYDNVSISSFYTFYRYNNVNIGSHIIDISNVILTGNQSNNYLLYPVYPIYSKILLRPLIANFIGGNKIYDGTQNVNSNTVIVSISGYVSFESFSYVSALYKFQNNQVGLQLIDVSNVILSSSTITNYYILPISPYQANIYLKSLTLKFTGGSKIYDSLRTIYNVNGSIINGIVGSEKITISSFITFFQNPNAGNQLIDISDIILYGDTVNNYNFYPVPPIIGIIYQKQLIINFFAGNKYYDVTTTAGPLLYSISGIISPEIITITNYNANFTTSIAGTFPININNIILYGLTVNNYYYSKTSQIIAIIYQKIINFTFSNGTKIYDGTLNTGNINIGINGLLGNDIYYIYINSYQSKFQNQNVGVQLIDISNLSINGINSNNYTYLPISPFNSYIYPKLLNLSFIAQNKIYDSLNTVFVTGNITSGIVNTETITISSFIAFFKNYNVGLQYVDISNLILYGSTVNNYYFNPINSIKATIFKKEIIPNFSGGSKYYDTTNIPGIITYSLSGIIFPEIITITKYNASFNTVNAGQNIINIDNIILYGPTINNYYINSVKITSYIYQKIINFTFTNGTKIYDGTLNTGNINIGINGLLGNDIYYIYINSYQSKFQNQNVGVQLIDISNLVFLGINSNNYTYLPISPFSSYIYPRSLKITFNGGSKVYDSTIDVNNLTFNITNIVNLEYITISYYAFFKNPNAGNQFIDVSNIILIGSTNYNYTYIPIQSILSFIYKTNLYAIFYEGSKIYDGTLIPGPSLYSTLNGIINNENISILSYSSSFNSPNSGLNTINIKNLLITGPIINNYPSINNYALQPIQSISAFIYPIYITINFLYGSKIYNGTLNAGSSLTPIIIGTIPANQFYIISYTALFRNPNIGANIIDISNLVYYQATNNYIINPLISISAWIYPTALTTTFTGGNKIYNTFTNTGIINYILSGIVNNEIITISSFVSTFRNPNVGYQIIDISNIILKGDTINNYYINPIKPILSLISPFILSCTFTANDKIYDGTISTYNVIGSLSGILELDIVSISSFTSGYNNYNIGYNRIDISNIVLTNNNYTINSIIPIYSNILPKILNITFEGGNKYYDSTLFTGPINYSISGLIYNDNIVISSFNSLYRNSNIGTQLIDISNINLSGYNSTNYIINPVNPILGIIYPALLNIYFINTNKVYDGTNYLVNTISCYITGIINSENIFITDYQGYYQNINIGLTNLIITSITLSGPINNYTINTINPIPSIIYSRPIYALFSGGNKIYDKTLITGNISSYLLNIANNENLNIIYFTSVFRNKNTGFQIIDISNVTISGITFYNYNLQPIQPITGFISPLNLNVSFTGNDKIYNSNIIAYVSNPILYGVIYPDNVSISSYNSYYLDPYVANNKIIYISNIITNNTNYIINQTITTSSNIYPSLLYLNSFGDTKIYDQTINASIYNLSLSGIYVSDISYISISSYTATFNDINSGINKIITISNIILNGPLSYNYYILYNNTLGTILPKPITGSFTGINKSFDSNTKATVINPVLFDIISPDNVYIYNYLSNFNDSNVGTNKIINVTNITLSGTSSNNYTISGITSSGSILYPINLSLSLSNNNILYKDISGTININYNPIFEIQQTYINEDITTIYFNNNYNIITTSIGNIYNSYDNITWNLIFSINSLSINSLSINSLYMINDNNGYAVCNDGYLLQCSIDEWSAVQLCNNHLYSIKFNNNIGIIVGASGTIYINNNNNTWLPIVSNYNIQFNDAFIIDINNIFIIGVNGVLLQTNNGGYSWLLYDFSVNLNSISMIDINNGYIAGNDGYLFRMNDGINWMQLVDISNNNWTQHDLTNVYMINNNEIFVVGNNGTVLKSNNRGISWFMITTGVLNTINKIYINKSIKIVGNNGLLQNYVNKIPGVLNIYDDDNLLYSYDISNNIINSTVNLLVKQYNINISFYPNNYINYSNYYSSKLLLNINPIVLYSPNNLTLLYDRITNDYSEIPFIDQSGGVFYIDSNYIDSNLGIITFNNNINVGIYNILVSYQLNNCITQIYYNLIIKPNYYYENNNVSFIYNNNNSSAKPYFNQPYGTFSITDLSYNIVKKKYVTINTISGIINISKLIPINNYNLLCKYRLNNVSNTTIYSFTILPYINYNPNITYLKYQTSDKSVKPFVDASGGIFTIYDISSFIVSANNVNINPNLGIINFNNNIPVGIYNLLVIYTINNIYNTFIYTVISPPYFTFIPLLKTLFYDHTIYDASAIPIVIPSGGNFTIIDMSGTLVYQNNVQLDNYGNIYFNNFIDVNKYSFLLTYSYNNAVSQLIYNLLVKPNFYYNISYSNIIYDTSAQSILPYTNPNGGIFTIIEVNNILVQTKYVNINYNTGIITFNKGIKPSTYGFNINYYYNNIYTTVNYNLQILPYIFYSQSTLLLLYGISGQSVKPIYNPLGGVFSISSIIGRINNNGVILFSNNNNVGSYFFNVYYTYNKLLNYITYSLFIIPQIKYPISSVTLLYNPSNIIYSTSPNYNQIGGIFTISSSLDTIIDLSGIIQFIPPINVGIYNSIVTYTLNEQSNYTLYNLTIKPNIILLNSYISLYYDRTINFISDSPFVDQSGGTFNLIDISGDLVLLGLANINYYYGYITLVPYINVGNYNVKINYTLNNSFNSIYYNISILPTFKYIPNNLSLLYGTTGNSASPIYEQMGGLFSLDYNISGTINPYNGILTFNNNLNVGVYDYTIIYTLDNISVLTYYTLYILPIFNYVTPIKILFYDISGQSEVPRILNPGGIFNIFDISNNYIINNNVYINSQTGQINFTYNINVGIHYFLISYTLNNASNTIIYELIINPSLYYSSLTSNFLYDRPNIEYSNIPIYQQLNGTFTINDYVGNLVYNNQVFISNSGIIIFNTLIDVGVYSFIVTYTLNQTNTYIIYMLNIIPNFYYSTSIIINNYGASFTSQQPYYNQTNGLFSLTDISGQIVNFLSINQNGIINFSNKINVGFYSFLITYYLNNTNNYFIYQLYILPNIKYSPSIKILNYNYYGLSALPIVSPLYGSYIISDLSGNCISLSGAFINLNTGLINFTNNINVGVYLLNISYLVNGLSNSTNYNLIINPYINYYIPNATILYNNNYINTSIIPTVKQSGGTFQILDLSNNLIKNNKVYIDLSGIIYFQNYIPVNNYSFIVIYTLFNNNNYAIYNLKVIPNLNYNNNFTNILYGTSYTISSPYYDQSGGVFSFSDISGTLVNDNLIQYDISYGTFTINNNIDVGLYNINILYTLNNNSNNFNYLIYIIPVIYYNINTSIIKYNDYSSSLEAFVNQSDGIFNIDISSIQNGIYISTISNGILYFNNIDMGYYNILVTYTLNSVSNFTFYNLYVLPVIYYTPTNLTINYDTSGQSLQPYLYPLNGFISIDISNYSHLISIDDLGILYFNNEFPVGIYNINVIYSVNNISNNTLFNLTVQPYLNYSVGTIQMLYIHDISYSEIPYINPSGGTFIASVPGININFTGISIDKYTGIIKFNKINAGNWVITITYKLNGISVITFYYLYVIATFYYTPPFATIPFNSIYNTNIPTSQYVGTYSLNGQVNGITINSNNGILYFNSLNIFPGNYTFNVINTVLNSNNTVSLTYTLIVSPSISYIPNSISTNYLQTSYSTYPIISPPGGFFTINNLNGNIVNGINIDISSGLVTISSILNVATYNMNILYSYNSSLISILFNVYIYPNIIYPIGVFNIIAGFSNYSEQPIVNPLNGIFSSTSTFYINKNTGIIQFKNTIPVGIYQIPVIYTVNNMSTTINYILKVYPLFKYKTNYKQLIYETPSKSILPTINKSIGQFNIVSISGTFNLSYLISFINQDRYIPSGVVLNGYTGLIYFDSNIYVGSYNMILSYTVNNFTSTTNYSFIVKPYINYSIYNLTLDYNTSAISVLPFVDQSGGYFNINSSTGNLNFSKVYINNKTGLINFFKGINTGLYKIVISYLLNQINNLFTYNLTIVPIFYYTDYNKSTIYGINNNSLTPISIQPNGTFSISDYGGINPINILIDYNTGIIYFYIIDVGIYNLIITYTFNNSPINTNYNLTVLPYINYPIGSITLTYGSSGISEIPIGLQPGGTFGFYDITSLTFQSTKVTIDSITGVINFASLINIGQYNIIIYYLLNNIQNVFTYQINIIPNIIYSISGSTLIYNNYITLSSIIPFINPLLGVFYFSDFSNNYPLNVNLNKNNGIIYFNKLNINNYNIGITYSLKNYINKTNYYLSIIPNFYYSINNITIIYKNDITYSCLPFTDPSGGIISEIIINVNQNNNLINNLNRNTGLITINNLANVGIYNLLLSYNYYNTSFTNYIINIIPNFYYNENSLYILYNTNANSSIPFISPTGGIFSISGFINYITIDQQLGIIYISRGIYGGTYNLNINYMFNNQTSTFNYTIYVVSNFYYSNSTTILNYGTSDYSVQPYIDFPNGLFTIPYINGIVIDASSGILNFSNFVPVNSYIIQVTYTIFNIIETEPYNLIVKPILYYDISNIIINYKSNYISNVPYVLPLLGNFTSNIGSVDSLGKIYLNNINVGYYNLIITYTVNNISVTNLINVTINPIIIYQPNIQNNIYGFLNISIIPFVNPKNGLFNIDTLNNNSIDNNGTITFTNNNVGIYFNTIYYTINNVTVTTIYNYIVNPYINYSIPETIIIGGNNLYSVIPDISPSGGLFTSNNLPFGVYLDNTIGILYFSSTTPIEYYELNINYQLFDTSSNVVYNLTVNPYIYYNPSIINYSQISYSELPIVNSPSGIYSLSFIQDVEMNINALFIDISSGLITFNKNIMGDIALLDVGIYSFYVNYIDNDPDKLVTSFTYSLTVLPVISYNNIIVNHYSSTSEYPLIINPTGGIFYSTDISSYGFIDQNFGNIIINNTDFIGLYSITIYYIFSELTNMYTLNLQVIPTINYNYYDTIIFGIFDSNSVAPITSISGGLFTSDNLPSGVSLDIITGILYYNNYIDVAIHNIIINYTYNNIMGQSIYILTVIPNLIYQYNTTLVYGISGFSEIPYVNPLNGTFNIIDGNNSLSIDNNGIIYFGSNIPFGNYQLSIQYIVNSNSNIVNYNLIITPKDILVNFVALNKIYDGDGSVAFRSNKLSGVINNDKVFIESYSASFITFDVGINIPIQVYNFVLGGPAANNYFLLYDGLAYGSIYYAQYNPNFTNINFGTSGYSVIPTLAENFVSPSFIMSISGGITDGITIDPYGVIKWNSKVPINVYNIIVTIYNSESRFNLIYTLNVTSNLYKIPLTVISPQLPGLSVVSLTQPLQFTNTEGYAYALNSKIPNLVSSFDITIYDSNNLIVHDLGTPQPFTYFLPNADPNNTLTTFELNDDGTINYDISIPLQYSGNGNWIAYIQYLSEYVSVGTKPLTFELRVTPNTGTYYSSQNVTITPISNGQPISGVTIYYSLDDTTPSIIYKNNVLIVKTCTLSIYAKAPNGYTDVHLSVYYKIEYLPCILSKSLIKTPDGYIEIDNVKVGTLITTSDNRIVPVISTLKYQFDMVLDINFPICIPTHFFGQNIPFRNTYITDNHAIFINENIVFGNDNKNILKKTIIDNPLYFNIELPNYLTDKLVINNLVIESWLNPKSHNFYVKYINHNKKIINNNDLVTVERKIINFKQSSLLHHKINN